VHETVHDQYLAAHETTGHIRLITSPESIEGALAGKTGTRIIRD
jgi:hypothetical protein